MGAIKRDFLPKNLELETKSAGIQGVVSVQARQTIEETRWLLELSESNPFVRGVIGWAPLTEDSVGDYLEDVASHPKLKGVRHVLEDEPDGEYALREDFSRGVKGLKKLGLVYDILIRHHQLPASISLVDLHPDQVFVLDHIAKPPIAAGGVQPWGDNLRSLAKRQNVYCKLSGMVTEAEYCKWTYEQLVPYMDIVLEAFGPDRIMFGSDWPVCLLSAAYDDWVKTVAKYLEPLSAEEKSAVWNDTAEKAYGL